MRHSHSVENSICCLDNPEKKSRIFDIIMGAILLFVL